MNVQYFAIGFSFLILVFVIELIREEKMTFKYALTWLTSSAVVLFFSMHGELIKRIAIAAGFALPSNFIFFLFLIFTILLSLLLTLYANEQNKRSEVLAQTVALLEYRMSRVEGGKDQGGAKPGA